MFSDAPYQLLGDFLGGRRQLTFPKDSSEVCVRYPIFIEPTSLAPEANETFDLSFTATGLLGGNMTTATGRSMVTIKDETPGCKNMTCTLYLCVFGGQGF